MKKEFKEDVNELVGRHGGEYKVVDYFFQDGDEFKGVTGSHLRVVGKEERKRRIENFYDEDYSPVYHIWEEQYENGEIDVDFGTWVHDNFPKREAERLEIQPASIPRYVREKIIEDFKKLNPDVDVHDVEVWGGGRMFGHHSDNVGEDWDVVFEEELVDKIEEVEVDKKDVPDVLGDEFCVEVGDDVSMLEVESTEGLNPRYLYDEEKDEEDKLVCGDKEKVLDWYRKLKE